MALLEVEDLTVRFHAEAGARTAVDGLSYEVQRGEVFGVVGESGAGKSVASLAVLGLLDSSGWIERGAIRFDGRDLTECPESELRALRGDRIAMSFQDAQAALDPVVTVGEQVAEAIRYNRGDDAATARERTVELFDRVGIPDPASRYDAYPHQLSGGLLQRVGLAAALSCDPDLLIADEPTTGLDVTTQAAVLERLAALVDEFDVAVQLVTHDLGVVARLCDRVAVLYAGEAVEVAPVEDLFYDPKHPYTVGLLSAMPQQGRDRERLQTIPGEPPDATDAPSGCRFHPRCPWAEDGCAEQHPPLVDPDRDADRPADRPSDGRATTSGDGPVTGSPYRSRGDRSVRCLAYTGDIDGELDYEVRVRSDAGQAVDRTRPTDAPERGVDD